MDFQDFQGFSEIFENHHFYSKNRGCQIGSKTFLTHPGHVYASGNDSPTPLGAPTHASSDGRRRLVVYSLMYFIKSSDFQGKYVFFKDFQGFSEGRGYPGWLAAARSGGVAGARETVGSARGGAAGVPESRNMLGMLLVVSLPIYMTIRGPKSIFAQNTK